MATFHDVLCLMTGGYIQTRYAGGVLRAVKLSDMSSGDTPGSANIWALLQGR